MPRLKVISVLLFSMSTLGFALDPQSTEEDAVHSMKLPNLAEFPEKYGISPAKYAEFWDKWPLVTVRYRRDNGEQRFIYANDIAYEAMKSGKFDYPDGSVFGKVAFKVEDDKRFPNSAEPLTFTRIQLMVKDRKKYTETDGWSYWLYLDPKMAKQQNVDPAESIIGACHACHTIVKDKDFIFASPTFHDQINIPEGPGFHDLFVKTAWKDLSAFEQGVLRLASRSATSIRINRMRLFQGSTEESIGPLTQYSADQEIYALVDPLDKRFVVVAPGGKTKECETSATVFVQVIKNMETMGGLEPVRLARRGKSCNGKNIWERFIELPKEFY